MSDVSIEDYCEMVEEYQARIAKLETALKWYANDINYLAKMFVGPIEVKIILVDGGAKAREALEE